jgi:hypothetical protein
MQKTANFSNNQIDSEINNKSNDIKENELLLKYKINKGEKYIKIFGFIFCKENKRNSYILFEGKKLELIHIFDLEKNKILNDTILTIKLIQTKEIRNLSIKSK